MFNIKICKCFVPNKKNISNFHRLEVVGRGSETQLQLDDNLNVYCSSVRVIAALVAPLTCTKDTRTVLVSLVAGFEFAG